MLKTYRTLFIIGLFLLTPSALGEDPRAALNGPTLEELKWLSGSWSRRHGDTESEEHWIEPRGGLMLGVNRTIRSSGKASFEFLRIADISGTIVYYASPGGRSATPFTLIKIDQRSVTFENPSNNFPQRVIYRRNGRQLQARIEGKINGQDRSMEWVWELVDRGTSTKR